MVLYRVRDPLAPWSVSHYVVSQSKDPLEALHEVSSVLVPPIPALLRSFLDPGHVLLPGSAVAEPSSEVRGVQLHIAAMCVGVIP